MSANAAIFDRLAAIMAEARPRLGAADFSEKRRVIGLLSDKAPDAKREIRAIGVAIDEGVPASLARTERQMLGVEMDRLANALADDTGIRAELARQVVRAFAFALDMGPPPSIYEAGGAAAMPPVPPPSGGDWAGMSTVATPAAPPAPAYQPMPPPAPATHPGGAYPAPPAYGTAPLPPPAPAYQPGAYPQGGYQQQPAYHAGQAPVPRRGLPTGAKIAIGVVGVLVVLGVIGTIADPEGGNRRSSAGSTIADWTCPRIAEHSVRLSQQQPIRLRSIDNVRETGRTTRDANCLGFATTDTGVTGDLYMRAYVEGTNIMVAYQGEPFPN